MSPSGCSRGRRATIGLPGTGLYWTTVHRQTRPRGRGSVAKSEAAPPPISGTPRARQKLTLSFFRRLVTPADEQAFVDGCRALVDGDHGTALAHLRAATHLADGAFMAGCLALQAGAIEEAATDLEAAVAASDQLGRTADRYGIAATLVLHITDEISASLEPNLEGALLALVEAYQSLGRIADAVAALRRLQALAPDDPVVRLSLAELLVHGQPAERAALEEAARLGENVPNDSAIHAALRLYRATAMRLTSASPMRPRRCFRRPFGGRPIGRPNCSTPSAPSGPSRMRPPANRSGPGPISSAFMPRHPATRMSRGAWGWRHSRRADAGCTWPGKGSCDRARRAARPDRRLEL